MEAIMKRTPVQGFSLEEIPPPVPGQGKLLIAPLYAAISAADLHLYQWDGWAKKYGKLPMVVGKEFVGEVVLVGKRVSGFAEGDLVSGDLGVDLGGAGCFADVFILPASKAYKIPRSIETKSASLIPSLAAAVESARKFSPRNKRVFISGAGPIGIMTALVLKHLGAKEVMLTDISPFRASLAKSLGLEVYETAPPFDLAFEMSGSPEGLQKCLELVKDKGSVVLVGFQPPAAEAPWKLIVKKQLNVQGIFGKSPKSFEMAIELAKGAIPLSKLITHAYPFEEYDHAFQTVLSGQCAKVLLEWKRAQQERIAPSATEAA